MAQFREREEDENDGIPVDLKQKVCPTCRRKLHAWEPVCPEDGAAGVAPVEMGAVEDSILSRLNPALLLDDDEDASDDKFASVWDEPAPTDEPAAPTDEPAPTDEVIAVPGDLPDQGAPDRQWPSETRWGSS
ncbi:MAG: hypothetical protein ACI867_001318 [Glaciecola sp.]|jgi:hypothetical protein